jgi:uncharacterized protein YaaN involved in tellurite resistance
MEKTAKMNQILKSQSQSQEITPIGREIQIKLHRISQRNKKSLTEKMNKVIQKLFHHQEITLIRQKYQFLHLLQLVFQLPL